MLRRFLQPHPTFGSYKNPDQKKVEASPYYYWWLALTLNDKYAELCDRLQNGSVTAANGREQQMLAVYKDFGDVRYEGGRHAAFAAWWTAKVGTYKSGRLMRRGEKLFAEEQTESVHHIYEPEHAAKITVDERFIVLAIPKINDKANVLEVLEMIVNKHFDSRGGRNARNPKYSTALYPMSQSTVPSSMNKAFTLYLVKKQLAEQGKQVAGAALAEAAKIDMGERKQEGADFDAFDRREAQAATVRRHLRNAKKMIENASIGVFP
ncbi:MAG: hypothetical protein HWE20_02455 [Gammaproteobacteria bacterium]|nr:hypothetical protein [Gammaproteobacteria bacterium]